MSSSIPSFRGKRPRALAPSDTPLTQQFFSYQMGPLTPAPFRSPSHTDSFEIDPLSHGATRPPLRPFPSLQPPRRPEERQQLLGRLSQSLNEERALGDGREFAGQVYQLLDHSREDIQRYLAIHHTMREDQTVAREGDIKSKKPLFYLLLALGGRFAIGMGATFLEHEVLPGQPKEPGNTDPTRPPPRGGDPGQRISNVHVMAGAMLIAAGSIASLSATYLFWRQASIKRPVRASCLAAAHITSLALAVIHSFLYEFVLFNRPANQLIILSAPAVVSAALYAYTVPNSLTAAETELGLMPIGSMEARMELALILGALGAGLKELGPGLSAQHGTSSYVKQCVSILGSISLAGGIGLAFSNARNFKARLDRGTKKRERAARHSGSDHARNSTSVRRPTALPAQIAQHVPAESRIAAMMDEEAGLESLRRPMLRTASSGQGVTPIEQWPSPSESPAGAQPVSMRAEVTQNDYFSMRTNS